jgi:hypothetical protein
VSNAHARSRLEFENWTLWRRPKGSDLGSRMPGWDEVEDPECRCERRTRDGTVILALLSELGVQQGGENAREDQYNDEGRRKGNHGCRHDGLTGTRLVMGIVMKGGGRLCHQD